MADELDDPRINLATLRAIVRELKALRRGDNLQQGNGILLTKGEKSVVISIPAGNGAGGASQGT